MDMTKHPEYRYLRESDRQRPAAPPPKLPDAPYYGEYDENGVDVSLIRYMLSLTPLQRLEAMERAADEALMLYEHGRRSRESKTAADR